MFQPANTTFGSQIKSRLCRMHQSCSTDNDTGLFLLKAWLLQQTTIYSGKDLRTAFFIRTMHRGSLHLHLKYQSFRKKIRCLAHPELCWWSENNLRVWVSCLQQWTIKKWWVWARESSTIPTIINPSVIWTKSGSKCVVQFWETYLLFWMLPKKSDLFLVWLHLSCLKIHRPDGVNQIKINDYNSLSPCNVRLYIPTALE